MSIKRYILRNFVVLRYSSSFTKSKIYSIIDLKPHNTKITPKSISTCTQIYKTAICFAQDYNCKEISMESLHVNTNLKNGQIFQKKIQALVPLTSFGYSYRMKINILLDNFLIRKVLIKYLFHERLIISSIHFLPCTANYIRKL